MTMTRFDQRLQKLRLQDHHLAVTFNSDRSAVRSLRGRLAKAVRTSQLREHPHSVARGFIKANRELFGKIDEDKELADGRVTVDRRDRTHIIFKQRLGDAEIIGGGVSVHYNADGEVYLVKSNLAERPSAPAQPRIGADKALQIALQHAGHGAKALPGETPALSFVDSRTVHAQRSRKSHLLCWKLTVVQDKGPDWIYLVDAIRGKVVLRYPADQTGSGTGYYSTGAGLNTDSFTSGGAMAYRLKDAATSLGWPEVTKPIVHTYDDAGSSSTGLSNYSQDNNDIWDNAGIVPANRKDDQRPEVDIHRFVQYTCDFYYTHFGYNGLDGAGLDAKAHAHNEKYTNNAFWSGIAKQIYFADGDGTTRDFMGPLDTVAHEYSHGVKYYLDVLQVYDGESGALNEATSDIFGAFIALAHPGDDPWPWHHGRQYRLDGTVGRNLMDPSRDTGGVVQYDATNNTTKWASAQNGFYPDHYSIRYTGTGDYHGVHLNAPIIGHALYLLIQGGTHRLSNVTVDGIGAAAVEDILWEALSTGLLTNTSDFADFRLACILACLALYPENLDYLASVKAAFRAVGVGPDLYVRDTISDIGDEPGVLSCMSPDIILRKTHVDATTLALMADMGNGSLGEEIDYTPGGASHDHYVYFRIQNRGATSASGRFRLFISPVSTFPTPATWTEVGHFDFASVPAAGGVWVPSTASECIPLAGSVIDTLGTGHFCFIGVIECDADPAPDYLLIDSVSEFHDFISKSNNYAWRNTNIVAVVPDSSGEMPTIEKTFRLNGFGRGRRKKMLEIDTRDLPQGTELVMWIPARHYFGLAVQQRRLLPERTGLRRPGMLDALRIPAIDRKKVLPLRLTDLTPAELCLDQRRAGRRTRLREYPVAVPMGKVIGLEGFIMGAGDKLDLRFTVHFPRQVGHRNAVLGFRERFQGKAIGQMNYVYRLNARG